MKATSGTDQVKRTKKERSNIERSDMEGRLPADIPADEIVEGKVAEIEPIRVGEPNLLVNNKFVMGTLRVLAKAPSFRRLTIIFINNSVTPLR